MVRLFYCVCVCVCVCVQTVKQCVYDVMLRFIEWLLPLVYKNVHVIKLYYVYGVNFQS